MDGFPESISTFSTIKAVSLAVPAMAELVGKELKGLDWWVSCGFSVKVGLVGLFLGIYLLLKTSNKWWFWLFDCPAGFLHVCRFVRSFFSLFVGLIRSFAFRADSLFHERVSDALLKEIE